jgi:hypothetical protein
MCEKPSGRMRLTVVLMDSKMVKSSLSLEESYMTARPA